MTVLLGRQSNAPSPTLPHPDKRLRQELGAVSSSLRNLAYSQTIEMALAVVSPQRFLPGHQVRVARRELAPLELGESGIAEVLAIVGRTERSLTLNLKAPLVINVERSLGHQVIANGDPPLRYKLECEPHAFRRIA